MKKFLHLHLFLFLLFFSPAAFAQNIGNVTFLDGVVIKTLPDRQTALKIGSPISLNDTIMTQAQSSVIITFEDNTTLSLGEGTQLKIDEYVYDAEEPKGNKAEFTVLKGPFHYVSGLIAKKDKPDVTLNLDFGSIGIRGTKIWRDMTMSDDGKPQCRIYVEDGSARVSNGKGFTTLKDGDGTRIVGRLNPPTSAKPWGEAAIADIKSKSPAIAIIEPEEPVAEPAPEAPSIEDQPEAEQPANEKGETPAPAPEQIAPEAEPAQ